MFRFVQHDSAISEMSSRYQCREQADWEPSRKKKSPRDFHRAISFKACQTKSGLGLFPVRAFLALRFQLGELLGRKNFFGLFEECLPAFLCATCLHAFNLPGFDLSFLVGPEI
jgi:hypothetical protein